MAQYRATDGGALGAEETQSITGTLHFTPAPNFFVRLRGTYQKDSDSAPSFAFISANAQAQGCIGQAVPGFNQRNGASVALNREYFCKTGVPSLDKVNAFVNPALASGPTVLVGERVITSNTALPSYVRDALRTRTVLVAGVPTPGRFWDGTPLLDHAGLARNSVRLSGQMGYSFDSGAALAFNVGYNQQDSIAFNDVDKTDVTSFASILAFRTKDVTIDGRFTSDPSKRIRVLLGASYFHGKTQFSQGDVSYSAGTVNQGAITNERADVPAIYGSIDLDVLPNLTVTAEARYQEDKITSFNAACTRFTKTFKDVLPRFIVSFKPQRDWNIYASYAEGVQPARLQTGFAGLASPPLAFPSQAVAYVQSIFPGIDLFSPLPKLKTYEIGMKQRVGGVTYSIALYQNDWSNALVSSAIFNPASCFVTVGLVTTQTFNTAACPLLAGGTSNLLPNNARIRGVEFAINARVSDSFTIDASVDYKDAKWKRYANLGLNAFVGLSSALGETSRARYPSRSCGSNSAPSKKRLLSSIIRPC